MSDSNAGAMTPGKEIRSLILRIVLGGVAMAVLTILSKAAVARWNVPSLLRPLLVLSQVVPLLVILRKPIPLRKSDELEHRIGMETMVFAFCGLLVVFIAADGLRIFGVAPRFAWKTEYLIGTMALLVVLGHGWARRRYR